MTGRHDVHRRSRFGAFALVVALTGLLLAPAVVFAPRAYAASGIDPAYTWTAAGALPQNAATYSTWTITKNSGTPSSGNWWAFGCFNNVPANLATKVGTSFGSSSAHPSLACNNGANFDDGYGSSPTITGAAISVASFGTGSGYPQTKWGGFAYNGVIVAVTDEAQPAADTTAPSVPSDLEGALHGEDQLRVSFTASTDNVAVTGYRWRDNAGSWNTWAAPIPCAPTATPVGECAAFDVDNAFTDHVVDLQARDAAGNWSASATLNWTACSTDDVSNCLPVDNPGYDGPADCAGVVNPASSDWHCLGWGQPPPSRPVHSASFIVEDFGRDMTAANRVSVIVGWTCLPTGSDGASSSTPSASQGVVTFRGQTSRTFAVDCGADWIGSFYVLGGGEPVGGWNDTNVTTGTPATWSNVTLWWAYAIPGAGEDPDALPPGYYGPEPAPTSGPAPAPGIVWPDLPLEPPVADPTEKAGCDFGLTDPSSWLCGLTDLFGKLLGLIRGILSFLQNLGSFLTGLFVPDLDVLQGQVDDLDASWDASPPGVMVGALGDVAAPITDLDTTPPATCQGVEVTLPLGAWSMSMHPLSTCSDLTQWILGILLPLESAVIYLGSFFLAFRIVTKPFGLDTPGVATA